MPGPEIEKMTTRCCGQRASRPDMALVKAGIGVLAGLFLALSGLATYVFFPTILKTQVELNLVLEPSSEVYSSWQRAPIPIYLKYYFFNMTNPDEILAGTEKPRLQELGPYTFLETREKVNITWNPNGTVSYRQVKRYYFQPDMTKGSLDDVITTLNMPMISSAHSVRFAPDELFREIVSEILSETESKLFVSKPARELLFEGYTDRIFQIAKSMDFPVPSERFGWLHGKNDTDDGEYTIFTGANGMDNYGMMDKFNGLNHTSAYHGFCSMVNGTVGDMWPPLALEDKDNITLFVSDFCRSIEMDFLGDVETRGVKLRRYFASPRMFNYSSKESRCFCDKTCLPSGALNVSACVQGSPVIITFPHFLHAHPFYQQGVEGMRPDPKQHQMHLDIEPKMGITVNAAAKFQVNVWIENIPDIPHSILRVEPYPSPRYGLCQTIRLANESMRKVRKTGPTLGMRLTLNIERSEYLDIISPEFGTRILIHPLGTLPSLERGGITLTPGSKSYISIRMRKIERLPEPYRGCSKSFNDSRITPYLREVGLDDLLQRSIYTFDFCQTLCREAALLRTCGCLDELSTSGRVSCDLCNVTQARCRTRYLRSYTSSSGGQQCKALCLPECVEVRYDLTTSQSEWPNFRQQAWAIKRWPLLNKRMQDSGIRWQEVLNATDDRVFMDELLAFRSNFMRVHIYIQEMNYLSVRDLPAYPLPQLFADLGGCLGLYIGVSAITIFEFLEHVVLLVIHLCEKYCGCCKRKRASQRLKADWTYPAPSSGDEKAAEYRAGDQQRRKPWSFLIRDREYPVLGRPPSRSPLFRTVYSSSRDYAAPPAAAPTRRPLYLGYTVPQHVDNDGGFFGRRYQTNKDSVLARVRSHRSDESREHARPRIL